MIATVEGTDKVTRHVICGDGVSLHYDALVLATGATHAYFGHDEWEAFAPGLKSLEDARMIRERILKAFEEAELCTDAEQRAALQTFVVIGGGPIGVELAGKLAELARKTLVHDFRAVDPRQSRVLLIEARPRLLPVFPETLSASPQRVTKFHFS